MADGDDLSIIDDFFAQQAPVRPEAPPPLVAPITDSPSIVDEFFAKQDRTRAQTNLRGLIEPQPDAAGSALQLGPKLGVAPGLVREDPKLFQIEQQRRDNERIMEQSPALRDFVAADPLNAEAATDSFEAMSAWEKAAFTLSSGFRIGELQQEYGLEAGKTIFGYGNQEELARQRKELADLNKDLPGAWWLLQAIGELGGELKGSVVQGGSIGLAGSAGMPPVVRGAAVGTAIAGTIAASALGRAYDTISIDEERTQQKVPEPLKVLAAVGIGSTEFIAERFALSPGASRALTDLVAEGVMRSATGVAVGQVARGVAESAVTGAAIMGTVQAINDVVLDAAKIVGGGDWDTFLNDPVRREEIVANVNRAMVQGAALVTAMSVPGIGTNAMMDRRRIQAANNNLKTHKQLLAQRDEIPVYKRAPEAFQQFAARVLGDKQIAVEIDDATDAAVIAELQSIVPDFAAKLDVAVSTGGRVMMDYSTYLSRISPEADALLHEGIAFDVEDGGGVSVKDAEWIEAWHGTPHGEFERFDYSRIGTGEGHQAYAYGLYFAENRKVSEEYRENLSSPKEVTPEVIAAINRLDKLGFSFASEAFGHIRAVGDDWAKVWDVDPTSEEFRIIDAFRKDLPGSLYRVRIRAKPEEMLDWEASFAEQPPAVQRFVNENPELFAGKDIEGLTGQEIYQTTIGADFSKRENQAAASERLRAAGVPGIRYLDQFSRSPWTNQQILKGMKESLAKGEVNLAAEREKENPREWFIESLIKDIETYRVEIPKLEAEIGKISRNIVTFSDDIVEILDRNGVPLEGAAREVELAKYAPPEVTYDSTGARMEGPALLPPDVERAIRFVKQKGLREAEELWLQAIGPDSPLITKNPVLGARLLGLVHRWNAEMNKLAIRAGRREATRRQTATWKKAQAIMRRRAKNEIRRRPAVLAYNFIRFGKLPDAEIVVAPDERIKLSIQAVREIAGIELPYEIANQSGVHPDDVAPHFGFNTGIELIQALAQLETQRAGRKFSQWFNEEVDALAKARMEEKFGDIAPLTQINAERIAAGLTQQEIMTLEAEIMAAQMRPKGSAKKGTLKLPDVPVLAQVRAKVRASFEKTSLREGLSHKEARRAVIKAGRAAAMAVNRKDMPHFKTALKRKTEQLNAHVLMSESLALQEEMRKAKVLWKKLAGKTAKDRVAREYLDQIHSLMMAHGIPTGRQAGELRRGTNGETLAAFATRKAAESLTPIVVEPTLHAPKPIKDLTVEEFRALDAAIRSLDSAGRDENRVVIGGENVALDWIVDQIRENVAKRENKEKGQIGFRADARSLIRSVGAQLERIEQIMLNLDNGDKRGPANRVLQRLIDALHYRGELESRLETGIQRIPKPPAGLSNNINNRLFREPLDRGGGFMEMKRWSVIMVILNAGNSEGRQRLMDAYNVSEPEIMGFIQEHAKPGDLQFAQGLIGLFEMMKPELDAQKRRLTGTGMKLVEAVPIMLPNGETIPGGYVPLMYDEKRKRNNEPDLLDRTGPTTNIMQGYFEERAQGYVEYLQLQGGDTRIFQQLKHMAHGLAFQEPLRDVNKIIARPELREEIVRSFGAEYYDQLPYILQHLANPNQFPRINKGFEMILRHARMGMTYSFIIGSYKTLLSPATGRLDRVIRRLGQDGAQTVAWGLNPEVKQLIYENSPEMRRWFENQNYRGLDDATATFGIKSRPKQVHDKWNEIIINLQSRVEFAFAGAEWLTTYNEAIAQGVPHEEAAALGDREIRRNYNRSDALGLATIFRGNEFNKALFPAFGYGVQLYNQLVQMKRTGGRLGRTPSKADFVDFLGMAFMLLVVQSAFSIFYTDLEEDDSYPEAAGKLLLNNVGQVFPGGREIVNRAVNDNKPRPIVAYQALTDIYDFGVDLTEIVGLKDVSGKPPKDMIRRGVGLAGMAVPTAGAGQIGRSAQFVADWLQDEVHPQDFWDVLEGLGTGKIEKGSR